MNQLGFRVSSAKLVCLVCILTSPFDRSASLMKSRPSFLSTSSFLPLLPFICSIVGKIQSSHLCALLCDLRSFISWTVCAVMNLN